MDNFIDRHTLFARLGNSEGQTRPEQTTAMNPALEKNAIIEANARKAFDTFYLVLLENGIRESYPKKRYEENRYWKSFMGVGELCYNEKWAPESYVKSCLKGIAKSSAILPYDLLRDQFKEKYKEYREAKFQDPQAEWDYCVMNLLTYVGKGKTELSVLRNPMLSFPAWFRVIYPEEIDRFILDNWGDIAAEEMRLRPSLIGFLAEKNPVTVAQFKTYRSMQ